MVSYLSRFMQCGSSFTHGRYPWRVSLKFQETIIKAVCNNYVDMPSYSIKEGTYCCGGGGGLLTDDLIELRVKGAYATHGST